MALGRRIQPNQITAQQPAYDPLDKKHVEICLSHVLILFHISHIALQLTPICELILQ